MEHYLLEWDIVLSLGFYWLDKVIQCLMHMRLLGCVIILMYVWVICRLLDVRPVPSDTLPSGFHRHIRNVN